MTEQQHIGLKVGLILGHCTKLSLEFVLHVCMGEKVFPLVGIACRSHEHFFPSEMGGGVVQDRPDELFPLHAAIAMAWAYFTQGFKQADDRIVVSINSFVVVSIHRGSPFAHLPLAAPKGAVEVQAQKSTTSLECALRVTLMPQARGCDSGFPPIASFLDY